MRQSCLQNISGTDEVASLRRLYKTILAFPSALPFLTRRSSRRRFAKRRFPCFSLRPSRLRGDSDLFAKRPFPCFSPRSSRLCGDSALSRSDHFLCPSSRPLCFLLDAPWLAKAVAIMGFLQREPNLLSYYARLIQVVIPLSAPTERAL